MWDGDFPDGPVVENLPSSAGDTGSIPGRVTKIPHATGQLSPWAANYWARALCNPRAATKIPRATTKTRHSQINNK